MLGKNAAEETAADDGGRERGENRSFFAHHDGARWRIKVQSTAYNRQRCLIVVRSPAATPGNAPGDSGRLTVFAGCRRQLFARQLQLIHLIITALLRQQLPMVALLHRMAAVQYQNGIGIDDGR